MKFRFSLERLKRVRAIEERAARAALSAAERTAREAEDRALAARAHVDAARASITGEPGAPLSPLEADLARRAIDSLLADLRARKERALTARAQAARAADAWRTRERDRRGLAELEDRRRTRFRREQEVAEAHAMDEAALRARRRIDG